MRNASLEVQPIPDTVTPSDAEIRSVPLKFAASLTLAAMSLGYGVVQLDVTIVNTALNSIVDAVDKIKQSAVATRRCFVVELSGC